MRQHLAPLSCGHFAGISFAATSAVSRLSAARPCLRSATYRATV
jgi:hypothetical protein